MPDDVLTQQLRAWGVVQNRRLDQWETVRAEHPIAQARDFAMSRKQARERLAGRDGRGRRGKMAAAAGYPGLLPTWACDPVPCKNDASPPRDLAAPSVDAFVDTDPPDDLRWIDRAVSQLSRVNLLRAMCLREEFCGTGTQAIKAARVAAAYGGTFTVRMFRIELMHAKAFLEARMTYGHEQLAS